MKRFYFNLFTTLFVLLSSPYIILADFLVEKIEDHGNDSNRMVLVIMGDGYTSLELDDYHQDVKLIIDEIFNASPWAEYKNFINVYRIDVVSNESGADHPSSNIYVDTTLDATYDTYGISRLLTVDDAKALDYASLVPTFDAVMVIVNDPQYGGSGGATMVLSNHEKSGRIALHEAGHLIGDLADEYETPYPGYPEGDSEPNVTYQTELGYIPWKNWIESSTPLPTSETGGDFEVGIYEGARYRSTGIYRPTYNSIMRSLSAPYGPINSEAVVLSLYNYVDPIDDYTPDLNNVFLSSEYSVLKFNVDLVNSSNDDIGIGWEIDGLIKENEISENLTLDVSTLKKGNHNVKVLVADYTSLVRHDPQALLVSSRTWNFNKEYEVGAISGTIVNVINNQGIEGALVETEGGEYSTISEANGSFRLTSVSEGIYSIIVSSDQYTTDIKDTIEVRDGEDANVTISLEPLFNTYSISGYIIGDLKEGVVNLKKREEIILTSEIKTDGSYSFKGMGNDSYTVYPNIDESELTPLYHEVTVTDDDLTDINFKVQAALCPAEVALEEESSPINLLRNFRNTVLAKNDIGRKYTNLYYKHAAELTKLIIAHEEIRTGVIELIFDMMPDINLLLEGEEALLSPEMKEELEALIDSLESYASPRLKKSLNMVRKDIKNNEMLQKLGVVTP
ncbi:MAG: carboxypeptidase regulatory-like domain-containing protein [Deltaproteobacteria bacterium]|nr:carboxypeptidase regulatory-like domain-containing protein [Deltaproteobacteria bacterium]